jgi:hypothetical protein
MRSKFLLDIFKENTLTFNEPLCSISILAIYIYFMF